MNLVLNSTEKHSRRLLNIQTKVDVSWIIKNNNWFVLYAMTDVIGWNSVVLAVWTANQPAHCDRVWLDKIIMILFRSLRFRNTLTSY